MSPYHEVHGYPHTPSFTTSGLAPPGSAPHPKFISPSPTYNDINEADDYKLTELSRQNTWMGIAQNYTTMQMVGEQARWRTRGFWREKIPPEDLVVPLLLLSFATGVLDAATLKGFATFTNCQTGNTILLVLACFGKHPANLLATSLSMIGFITFGMLFGQLGLRLGHRTRRWLLFTMAFQTVLLLVDTLLVSPAIPLTLQKGGPFEWAVVFLSAAQGGAQVTMVPSLLPTTQCDAKEQAMNSGVPEISTALMTGTYASLICDPHLTDSHSKHLHTRARNRRIVYIIVFWVGAFLGGAIAVKSQMWIAMVLALECKAIAMIIMSLSGFMNPPEL